MGGDSFLVLGAGTSGRIARLLLGGGWMLASLVCEGEFSYVALVGLEAVMKPRLNSDLK